MEENTPIDSSQGITLFMRKMIKHRESFPKNGSHDAVLDCIRQKLVRLGVCCTLMELRAIRRRLKEQYRRNIGKGRSDDYANALVVAFGGGDINSVTGTDYDPNLDPPDQSPLKLVGGESVNDKLAKYCQGNVEVEIF